jgi:hypothetical protein
LCFKDKKNILALKTLSKLAQIKIDDPKIKPKKSNYSYVFRVLTAKTKTDYQLTHEAFNIFISTKFLISLLEEFNPFDILEIEEKIIYSSIGLLDQVIKEQIFEALSNAKTDKDFTNILKPEYYTNYSLYVDLKKTQPFFKILATFSFEDYALYLDVKEEKK